MFTEIINKFKKPILAGLDISSTSVKLLVLSRHQKKYHVENFDIEPLPFGAMSEKEIKKPELVAEAIKKLKTRSKLNFNYAAVAVADASVITKIVQMDEAMTESEIEAQILYEAEKYIPYPIEEVRLDFEVMDENHDNGQVDVLLAASRSETVDQYLNAAALAGIELKVVDIESHALLRACQLEIDRIETIKPDSLVAIYDIGSTRSVMSVVRNEKPLFTRSDAFGGARLEKYIGEYYQKNAQEVEDMMKKPNWIATIDPSIISMFSSDVVETIRRELQYFSSVTHYDDINYLLLAGGASKLPDLATKIRENLNISAYVANPFQYMTFSKDIPKDKLLENAPAYMQTCGLALRGFDA